MTASLDGLHPAVMRPRVEALLADADARRLGLYVVSAFRSIDLQRQLYQTKLTEVRQAHPSWTSAQVAQEAGKWVAPPGRSNHGPTLDDAGNKVTDQAKYGRWGSAVDIGIPGHPAVSGQWPPALEAQVNAIAARHGLASPMDWEDWHFEPTPNWTPPASHPPEEHLMRDERIIVVPPPDEHGRQLVGHDKAGAELGLDDSTSSVQVKASNQGVITPLLVQPYAYGDKLALSVAKLDGSPAPSGAEARVVIEHR